MASHEIAQWSLSVRCLSRGRGRLIRDSAPPFSEMADGMKKLLNSPDHCVDECLSGLAATHPRLGLHASRRVVLDSGSLGKRKVGVISGGGSGHEPFPAGYVGEGMLTAAVCGSVFASPPSSNILYAIQVVARSSPGGVLVLIPNYTGDILNFGLAVELAKSENINVDSLIVGDDIAQSSQGGKSQVGRRGMVGIVAVFKAAGSAARSGSSLAAVRAAAAAVMSDTASLGVALAGSTLPGALAPLFVLAPDEIEIGVGVHGEAGIKRLKLQPARDVVALCLDHLMRFLSLGSGGKVVVLLNNLGAASQLEQWVVAAEIAQQLSEKGVKVARIYAAPLFTSLNMPGVQICLLRLTSENEATYLAALDEETTAPAWPGGMANLPVDTPKVSVLEQERPTVFKIKGPKASCQTATLIKNCLSAVTANLRHNEEKLNLLDSGCGDGDCGTTLRHLADGIDRKAEIGDLTFEYPATLALELASVAASTMGGTSGAIYSLFLTYAADSIAASHNLSSGSTWSSAWRSGILGVQKYSRARVGDRTMFDSLEPALEAFEKALSNAQSVKAASQKAVDAAIEGCEKTKTMGAKAGRASYVEATRVMDEDAGAYAVTVWLQAIAEALP